MRKNIFHGTFALEDLSTFHNLQCLLKVSYLLHFTCMLPFLVIFWRKKDEKSLCHFHYFNAWVVAPTNLHWIAKVKSWYSRNNLYSNFDNKISLGISVGWFIVIMCSLIKFFDINYLSFRCRAFFVFLIWLINHCYTSLLCFLQVAASFS